jgi:hypothetical protein
MAQIIVFETVIHSAAYASTQAGCTLILVHPSPIGYSAVHKATKG